MGLVLPGSDRIGGPVVAVPATLDPFDELVGLLDRGVAIPRHEPRDPLGLVGREDAIRFAEGDGVVAEANEREPLGPETFEERSSDR